MKVVMFQLIIKMPKPMPTNTILSALTSPRYSGPKKSESAPNVLRNPPRTVANNIIQGGGPAASIIGPSKDPVWEGNIIFNTDGPGDMPSGSYVSIDPKLALDAKGEYHLQKNSPAINTGKGIYVNVSSDMDGQARKSPLDVGADEISTDAVKAMILNPGDVGVMAGKNRN